MWLVIGFGSVLHSDDGFGPAVASRVEALAGAGTVEVITSLQLLPEFAEPISRAEGVIFVDASAELTPGRLEFATVRPPDADRPVSPEAFTHHCTPESLLENAATLFEQAPPAWLCSVGAQTFEMGETLSPAVLPAVDEAAIHILGTINNERTG